MEKLDQFIKVIFLLGFLSTVYLITWYPIKLNSSVDWNTEEDEETQMSEKTTEKETASEMDFNEPIGMNNGNLSELSAEDSDENKN